MADVFISYARRDRARIELLAGILEDAGYSVWWDHEIAGGAAFAAEIERALNAAKAVVVAWSINGVKSEWVIDEASAAKQAGKIVPIRLDATPPPMGFRQYQVVDFSTWAGAPDADAVGALERSIERFVRTGTGIAHQTAEEYAPALANAIAVLPLENFTGDPSQQFFVDGMHDALIADLSKIGALRVISRTSTRQYAGSAKSLREIGAELGVSRIIEGSVARVDREVRITVQLVDVRTDTHIWAESFDRDIVDILKLQREVARAIAESISVVLTPVEAARLAAAPRVRPEAYEAYLKGMYHWYKLSPQDSQRAFEFFDAALAADPDYAPAHAGIAQIWAGYQQMGQVAPAVSGPKIKAAVDRALELDPDLAQAHFSRAVYYTWTAWDWRRAEPAFERAIALNPNFPDSHAYYAHYLYMMGRFDTAEIEIRRAIDLDPFNPLVKALYMACLMFGERYDEALEQARSILAAAPDHWLAFQIMRIIYHNQGMQEQALDATRSLYTTLAIPDVVVALDRGYEEAGYRRAFARAADALAERSQSRFVLPTQVAILYGMADDVQRTVTWLRAAFDARDPDLPYLKHLRRFPDAVMHDPRTQEIIRNLNYPPTAES